MFKARLLIPRYNHSLDAPETDERFSFVLANTSKRFFTYVPPVYFCNIRKSLLRATQTWYESSKILLDRMYLFSCFLLPLCGKNEVVLEYFFLMSSILDCLYSHGRFVHESTMHKVTSWPTFVDDFNDMITWKQKQGLRWPWNTVIAVFAEYTAASFSCRTATILIEWNREKRFALCARPSFLLLACSEKYSSGIIDKLLTFLLDWSRHQGF